MDDNTKITDLTLGDLRHEMRSVPNTYFLEDVKRLGVELTGKDITKVDDVRCIRKTFDASQKCRVKKEKTEDTFLTETIKRRVNLVFLIAALVTSFFALLKS